MPVAGRFARVGSCITRPLLFRASLRAWGAIYAQAIAYDKKACVLTRMGCRTPTNWERGKTGRLPERRKIRGTWKRKIAQAVKNPKRAREDAAGPASPSASLSKTFPEDRAEFLWPQTERRWKFALSGTCAMKTELPMTKTKRPNPFGRQRFSKGGSTVSETAREAKMVSGFCFVRQIFVFAGFAGALERERPENAPPFETSGPSIYARAMRLFHKIMKARSLSKSAAGRPIKPKSGDGRNGLAIFSGGQGISPEKYLRCAICGPNGQRKRRQMVMERGRRRKTGTLCGFAAGGSHSRLCGAAPDGRTSARAGCLLAMP